MKQLHLRSAAVGFVAALAFAAGYVAAQSSVDNPGEPTENFAITNFPMYGALVTPGDTAASDFSAPSAVRANASGAIKVNCWRGGQVTLTLVAGEFVPCQVRRVFDTDTDAITLHRFW